MPIERRDILFYLNEFWPHFLLKGLDRCDLDGKISDDLPVDLTHTRNLQKMSQDRRDRFKELLGHDAVTRPGLLVTTIKRGFVGKEKPFGFLIPENIAYDVLTDLCMREEIRLPKNAKKEVIADNLMIGLRITMDQSGLELE